MQGAVRTFQNMGQRAGSEREVLAEVVAHLRCCQNIQVGSSQTGPEPRAAIWFANYLPVGENCHLDTERDCHQRKNLGRDKRTAEAHLVKEAT